MARQQLPPFDWKTFPAAKSEALLYAYATAAALCMVGLEKPTNVSRVISDLRANPTPTACEKYLVQRGAQVHTFTPFDMAEFSRANDSFGFLHDYYKSRRGWTNEWQAHWTENADSYQEAVKELVQLSKRKVNYSVEIGEVSLSQVTAALDGTQVVSLMMRPYGTKRTELGMNPLVIHEWQPEQRQFVCHDPESSGMRVVGLQELRKYWLTEEGMTIISA